MADELQEEEFRTPPDVIDTLKAGINVGDTGVPKKTVEGPKLQVAKNKEGKFMAEIGTKGRWEPIDRVARNKTTGQLMVMQNGKWFDPNSRVADMPSIVRTARDESSQRDPGIDYLSGVQHLGLRAQMSRMENDAERAGYLDKKVGKDNWDQDSFGAYYVKPAGLKELGVDDKYEHKNLPVAISPQQSEAKNLAYDAADYTKDVPAVAGAVAASLATGGVGTIPAMLAAAGGAAGGETINQGLKAAQGLNKRTGGEVAGEIAAQGVQGGLSEGLFRAVRGGARLVKGGYSPMVDASRKLLLKDAMDQGFVPSLQQSLGGAGPILQREQGAAGQLFGSRSEVRNTATMKARVKDFLLRGGVDPKIAEGRTAEVLSGRADSTEVGAALKDSVARRVEGQQAAIETDRNALSQALDKDVQTLNAKIGVATPDVGNIVKGDIVSAKNRFMQAAGSLYAKVDELAGGRPFVPTAPLKAAAQEIKDRAGDAFKLMPPETQGFINKITELPALTTASSMQAIRKTLADAAESKTLVGQQGNAFAEQLRKGASASFESARDVSVPRNTTLSKVEGGIKPDYAHGTVGLESKVVNAGREISGNTVVNNLRLADEFYANGVKKFDLPEINRLTMEAQHTGRVDPEGVVKFIAQPGKETKLDNILSLVGPETKRMIARSHWDQLVTGSKGLFDGQERISGKKLYDSLLKNQTILERLNGKETTEQMLQTAKNIGALDAQFAPSELKGGFANGLKIVLDKQKALDAFHKDHFLSQLQQSGVAREQAVDYVLQPKNSQRVIEASKFFGEKSPEMQGIREAGIRKIMSGIATESDDPLKTVFSGNEFKKMLNHYGRDTLDALYGKDMTKDLYKFADVAQFLTARQTRAGGLVAASYGMSPIKNFGKLTETYLMGRLFADPSFVKWLAFGMDAPTSAAGKAALATTEQLTRTEIYKMMLLKDRGTQNWSMSDPPTPDEVANGR